MKSLFQTQLQNMSKGAKIGGSIGSALSFIPGIGPLAGMAGSVAGAGIGNFVGGIKNISSMLGANNVRESYSPEPAIFAKFGAEVEGGETLYRPNGTFRSFNGPSHAQGGIGYNPFMKGEFIFSDTAGFADGRLSITKANETFADVSKRYSDTDDMISMNTLDQLKDDNKQVLKYGGYASGMTPPKYNFGGLIGGGYDPLRVSGPFQGMLNYSPADNTPLGNIIDDYFVDSLFDDSPFGIPSVNAANNLANKRSAINSVTPITSQMTSQMSNNPVTSGAMPVAPIAAPVFSPMNGGVQPAVPSQQPIFTGQGSPMATPQVAGSPDINTRIAQIAAATKIPSMLFNFAQGMKSDVEPLRLNREGQNAINIMSDLKYDPRQAYNRINEGAAIGRNRVAGQNISPFLQSALNQGITNSSMSALASANLQGQQMNNQYRAQEAQTRYMVGAGDAAERIRKQTADAQNRAANISFLQAGFNDIARGGDTVVQGMLNNQRIQEFGEALPYLSKDFMLNLQRLLETNPGIGEALFKQGV